jgi:nucleoside-diphosphate-sugar epimerase
MRALVTGSTGILGRELVNVLTDANVSCVCERFDIRNSEETSAFVSSTRSIDAVFHCAAIVPTAQVASNPSEAYEVNAVGAFNVARFVRRFHPTAKFVLISSGHVYAPSEHPVLETDTCDPISLYGHTKLVAEKLVRGLYDDDERLLVARVFSMYHEKQTSDFLYGKLMKMLAPLNRPREIELPGGSSTRDFTHAIDVAQIIFELWQSSASGVYNVGSGKPCTVAELAKRILGEDVVIKPTGSNETLIPDLTKLYEQIKNDKK